MHMWRKLSIAVGIAGYILSMTPIVRAQSNSINTSPQIITPPNFSCTVNIDNPHGSSWWSNRGQSRVASHAWMSCSATVKAIQVTAILSQDGSVYWLGNTWITEDKAKQSASNTYQIPAPGPQASWQCPYPGWYNEWMSQGVGYTVFYNGTEAIWNSTPPDRTAMVACPTPKPVA